MLLYRQLVVEPSDLNCHLTTECKALEWIQRNHDGTKGSLGLLPFINWQNGGFKIKNLENMESNVAVIMYETVTMLKRKDEGWRLATLSVEPTQIDCYFKPYSSPVYEEQTILELNSYKTMKMLPSLQDLPTIPLNTKKLEIIRSKKQDEDELETLASRDSGFFENLLRLPER